MGGCRQGWEKGFSIVVRFLGSVVVLCDIDSDM